MAKFQYRTVLNTEVLECIWWFFDVFDVLEDILQLYELLDGDESNIC